MNYSFYNDIHVQSFRLHCRDENARRCPETRAEYYRWLESQPRMAETPSFLMTEDERRNIRAWRVWWQEVGRNNPSAKFPG